MPEVMPPPSVEFPIIVIGGSAGGFEGIKSICAGFPENLGAAVLIVWHMSAQIDGFVPKVLNKKGRLPAKHPKDHEELRVNHIYVAPPDHHMTIQHREIRITKGPKENRFRPAIDPLFRSAAYFAGPLVTGVILSGFLDDGSSGLWTVKHFGGKAIIQDPEEAEVPAMPHNAGKATSIDYKLPVDSIAAQLTEICQDRPDGSEHQPVEQHARIKREIDLATQRNTQNDGIMEIGKRSLFSCPDCQGVLSSINEGKLTRFRCHTGHAYTMKGLMEALDLSRGKPLQFFKRHGRKIYIVK